MYCKQCGKEIPDGQDLCDECTNAGPINQTPSDFDTNQNSNYNTSNVPNQNFNQYQNYNQAPNQNPNAKSKLAAGLLGIFLGGLGVHNFYLGYTGKAIAQLLISLLSCGILAVVSSIWGLVEGILILTGSINTDGHGNPLRD